MMMGLRWWVSLVFVALFKGGDVSVRKEVCEDGFKMVG